ncbi:hypothetical protein EHO61_06355 [Leptospira fluminis]|uniref:Uncharacterized protein n=1 Tax=Leptospira fluminis TaxID=2484979 RepID=A0A4R9GQY9_9LEPT|nr:hypothetical protein [Leptospira fluminis]TGK20120.1 hypothetical protein EHO61_06355 [Leptospira fluminis]
MSQNIPSNRDDFHRIYKGYESFLREAGEKFNFLCKDNNYHLVESGLFSPTYYRDANAKLKYSSSKIGIEISWFFPEGLIDITFFELKEGRFPISSDKEINIFDIYDLVEFIKKSDPLPFFVLKSPDNISVRMIKKRQELLSNNLSGILDNLVENLKENGKRIFDGDLKIFSEIQEFNKMKVFNKT